MDKPKFLEDIPPGYYEDPYKTAPVCKVNLLELSRYARKLDKKLVDLTKEEVERFAEDEHTMVWEIKKKSVGHTNDGVEKKEKIDK